MVQSESIFYFGLWVCVDLVHTLFKWKMTRWNEIIAVIFFFFKGVLLSSMVPPSMTETSDIPHGRLAFTLVVCMRFPTDASPKRCDNITCLRLSSPLVSKPCLPWFKLWRVGSLCRLGWVADWTLPKDVGSAY